LDGIRGEAKGTGDHRLLQAEITYVLGGTLARPEVLDVPWVDVVADHPMPGDRGRHGEGQADIPKSQNRYPVGGSHGDSNVRV
jgi:hypothetical protein